MVLWKSPGFGEVKQKQGSWDSNLMALSSSRIGGRLSPLRTGEIRKTSVSKQDLPFLKLVKLHDLVYRLQWTQALSACRADLQSSPIVHSTAWKRTYNTSHLLSLLLLLLLFWRHTLNAWFPLWDDAGEAGAAREEEVRSQQESWSFGGVQPRMVPQGGVSPFPSTSGGRSRALGPQNEP